MRYSALFLLIVCAYSFSFTVSQSYAWNGNDGVNIGFELKKGIQWFTETITIDPIQKQKIILSNMASWQNEKETLIQNNQPIPPELDEIISEKQSDIKNINTESISRITLLLVYVLIPPRRCLDYAVMKLSGYDKKVENYFDGKSFVFNIFKTAKNYGEKTKRKSFATF